MPTVYEAGCLVDPDPRTRNLAIEQALALHPGLNLHDQLLRARPSRLKA